MMLFKQRFHFFAMLILDFNMLIYEFNFIKCRIDA